jgi:hypothetical protein
MSMSGIAAAQVAAQNESGVVEGKQAARGQQRDRALDVLRGWAVILMVLSHVAPSSAVSTLAHLPFWISAADSFILISGIVLGVRAASRAAQTSTWNAYRHIFKRAFELYLVHVALMFAVVAIHETTGKLDVASVASVGGFLKATLLILSLRLQSNDYMNILPLFILFMLAAPIGLEACRRGFTLVWLTASMLLWAFAQHNPNVVPLLHPASGETVFSIGAWQFIFCIGMAVGFHREKTLVPFWRRNRHLLWPAMLGVTGTIFLYAQLQRDSFGLGISLPESVQWLFAKPTWAPIRALYTLGLLFVGYVVLRRYLTTETQPSAAKAAIVRYLLTPLEFMGQKSLYCFIMHLAFALTATAFATSSWNFWYQELLVLGSIFGLYALAKKRVLARYLPA